MMKGGEQMNRLYVITISLLLLIFISVHFIYAYGSSVTMNADSEVTVGKVVRINESKVRSAVILAKEEYVARARAAKKAFLLKQGSDETTATEFYAELDENAEANEETSITETVDETESADDVRIRPVSSTTVSAGQGWAIHGDEGVFVHLVFAEKQFLNNQTNQEIVKSRGLIKLGGMPMYKLVLVSETENSMTFNVTGHGKDTVAGTLELTAQNSLSGFTVWKGNLSLDSLSYDIMVATQHKVLRDKSLRGKDSDERESNDTDSDENKTEGKSVRERIGFWARFISFFRR